MGWSQEFSVGYDEWSADLTEDVPLCFDATGIAPRPFPAASSTGSLDA